MVSSKYHENMTSKFQNYTNKTDALNDWIKDVKNKKIVKKKQSRGDLRMLAILSNTLWVAEEELRKKQNERNMKWTQIKMRLNANSNSSTSNSSSCNLSYKINEEEEKQKNEINALWTSELNGLDNFINNLSKIKSVVVR